MEIALLAFDGMTALDAVGPAQVLAFLVEYAPEPPFDTSARTAPPAVLDAALRVLGGGR